MPLVVDSENVVNSLEEAPDRLRAEIGRYYSTENRGPFNTSFAFFRSGIKTDFVQDLPNNNQQLIPTKKFRIFVSGRDEQFRDQQQWSEYVSQTIDTNRSFLDHQFSLMELQEESSVVKNFHHPDYEDLTKTYPSNQLLNYNLISYRHKDKVEKVKSIGDLVTSFDEESYVVDSQVKLRNLFDQFKNRISNYKGPIEEIDLKQRNIFKLSGFGVGASLSGFPYYYKKELPVFPTDQRKMILTLVRHGKLKNVLQFLKNNLAFSNRDFNIGTVQMQGKIHNIFDALMTTRISRFSEQSNELFLMTEDETDHSQPSRRFVEQLSAVRLLSDVRSLILQDARGISEIFDSQTCKSFFLGYKIEKYLDNDVGTPIQTYYQIDNKFYDTQLKYGREYIYKTKVMIGVLGSSYQYSNLYVSQNETEMISESGELLQVYPGGFSDIANEKYRAYVDVEVTPSFQILEYEMNFDRTSFVDVPAARPQVAFHNNSKKPSVEFFFSPMMFVNQELEYPGSTQSLDDDEYDILSGVDRELIYLIGLSDNTEFLPDYFTGIYEIYRLDTPPKNISEFATSLLATVDDKTSVSYPSGMSLPPFPLDNMNGYFEDMIVPNKKYYYIFRSLTYHGSPSKTTGPFEVELQQDSDEYKVVVKEYKYPQRYIKSNQREIKRILRVLPNLDRLQFSELEKNSQNTITYKIDEDNMLNKSQSKKIKLRITSKHTGKKMDININLVLKEDTNSFTQN